MTPCAVCTIHVETRSKITVTVLWFGPQNQASFGLSFASQNRQREDNAGHASRLVGLLRLEASHARVS
jgi:hypothetical protein